MNSGLLAHTLSMPHNKHEQKGAQHRCVLSPNTQPNGNINLHLSIKEASRAGGGRFLWFHSVTEADIPLSAQINYFLLTLTVMTANMFFKNES